MVKQIDIHIFGMDEKLFEQIFPKEHKSIEVENIGKIENRKKYFEINFKNEDLNLLIPFFIEKFRKSDTIIWNAFNYPKLLDNNNKVILKYFYKSINVEENRNNIVIKFSNSYIKNFSSIFNKIKKNKPFLLYVLKNEINENEFNYFKCPQFISYIKDCDNYNDKKKHYKFVRTIISYIIEKQTYFFELDSTFQNLFEPNCFIECNILLMGESRAGKSSFINRVFNKLVSHEDANLESVTNKSSQYTFYKEKVGIKFIDTPGIMEKSNIKQILDKYFEKIHLIFFFIKAQSNLDNCIEILQFINHRNKKNVKDGKKKIPILFIKNGEDLVINNETPAFFKYLKGVLKTNNIFELYDEKFNQKKNEEDNKINELDDEDLFNDNDDIENNYDNYCEGNIIQIHIPTGKNMNKIFWLSKEYLIENNKYLIKEKDDEFFQIKEYIKNLIKFFIKEKIEKNKLNKEEKEEKKTLMNRCNEYIDKNKMNAHFCLNNNKIQILDFEVNKFKLGIGFLTLFLIGPYAMISFLLPTFVISSIANIYIFIFEEFFFSTSIQYGFDEKDLIEYDLKKYIIENNVQEKIINEEKENKNNDENIKEKIKEEYEIIEEEKMIEKKDNNNIKEIQKKMKYCDEFFEKLLSYIGPIPLFIKTKELSKELFDLFEELKNRKEKEWTTYQIHEFNK